MRGHRLLLAPGQRPQIPGARPHATLTTGCYGEEKRGDELPEELRRREDRLAKIEAAMERLKARQAEEDRQKGRHPGDGRKSVRGGRKFKREFGEPGEKAQDNFTDPDSVL